MLRLLGTSIFLFVSLHAAVFAEGTSGPEWIWSATPRALGTPVRFEKGFSVASAGAAATLRLAVDFCEASVWLDGKVLGRAGRGRAGRAGPGVDRCCTASWQPGSLCFSVTPSRAARRSKPAMI